MPTSIKPLDVPWTRSEHGLTHVCHISAEDTDVVARFQTSDTACSMLCVCCMDALSVRLIAHRS